MDHIEQLGSGVEEKLRPPKTVVSRDDSTTSNNPEQTFARESLEKKLWQKRKAFRVRSNAFQRIGSSIQFKNTAGQQAAVPP